MRKPLCVALLALTATLGRVTAEDPGTPVDPLAGLGTRATEGAAAGYVADRVCAICHVDLAESYRQVGMARSFFRPGPDNLIERLDGPPFFHPPSGRYYEMRREDGGLLFRRYRRDDEGRATDLYERRVDWILGSGHTSRSYLFQTPGGELYQLPISWYSQPGRWGMAPGYDRADHQGITRRVRRECMFCHNGYPEVAAGADHPWSPQRFPSELPEGTGCQRCHGPGAEHSRIALRGAATPAERAALGESIVNPARLPALERDSVCLQCHLQPSVAFTGLRRFGRGDYSFRPGEPLSDYLLAIDPLEEGRARHQRFEINHHPYRLMQSRCWLESEGRLSCLSCHDPHRKVPAAERAAHYRAACLGCHEAEACGRDRHGGAAGAGDVESADCASCHMPRRRTEDVVQVSMTDHFIRPRPAGDELLAPLAESDPVIRRIEILPLVGTPEGSEAELYRAAAAVRANPTPRTVDRLAGWLGETPLDEPAPWLDLARGQLAIGRLADVEAVARRLLAREPELALAHEWLGISLAGQGRPAEAEPALRRALELDPARPEAHFNLALLLLAERPAEAEALLERAVDLRPVLADGWYRLADARLRQGRHDPARAALMETLAIDPDHAPAAAALRTLDAPPPPPPG